MTAAQQLKLGKIYERAKAELEGVIAGCDAGTALQAAMQRLHVISDTATDPILCMTILAHVDIALRQQDTARQLNGDEEQRLISVMTRVLDVVGPWLKPAEHAHLHQRRFEVVARALQRAGRSREGLAPALSAVQLAGTQTAAAYPELLLGIAAGSLNGGNPRHAIACYDELEQAVDDPAIGLSARLGRLRCQRLMGDVAESKRLFALTEAPATDHAALCDWRYEQLALEAVALKHPDRLIDFLTQDTVPTRLQLMAYFWAHAGNSARSRRRARPPHLIKRYGGDQLQRSSLDYELYQVASAFEALVVGPAPVAAQLDAVAALEARIAGLDDIEARLLGFGALLRFCFDSRLLAMTHLMLARYQALTASLGGNTADPLGVIGDLLGMSSRATPASKSKEMPAFQDGLPTSSAVLFKDFAYTVGTVAGLATRGVIKRALTGDKDEKIRLEEQQTKAITKALIRFAEGRRGVVVKVGQILSYINGPLMDEVRQDFKILLADMKPLSPLAIERVFAADFGARPSDVFANFDVVPIGAGSLGQVHRAVTKQGDVVAVKIQYPDIKKIIEIDLRRTRLLQPLARRVLPNLAYDDLVDELCVHVLEEADYRIERKNLEEFSRLYADDPDVIIPKVYPELCSEHVLTMELIDGLRFDDFNAQATQDQRNKAGSIIARMVYESNFRYGIFNADTQPANFMFCGERVAFIDFGCVKRYPSDFMTARLELAKGILRDDRRAVAEFYVKAGFVKSAADFDVVDACKAYQAVLLHVLHPGPFMFEPDTVRRVYKTFVTDNPHRSKLRISRHALFSSRIETGLFALLGELRATADWRGLLLPILFPDGDFPMPLVD